MYGERPSPKKFERAANRHLTRVAFSELREETKQVLSERECGFGFMLGYLSGHATYALVQTARTRLPLSTGARDRRTIEAEREAEGLRGTPETLDDFANRRLRETRWQETWEQGTR